MPETNSIKRSNTPFRKLDLKTDFIMPPHPNPLPLGEGIKFNKIKQQQFL